MNWLPTPGRVRESCMSLGLLRPVKIKLGQNGNGTKIKENAKEKACNSKETWDFGDFKYPQKFLYYENEEKYVGDSQKYN